MPAESAVLVCFFEKHLERLIQVNLERQGYAVTTVLDGHVAVNMLNAKKFGAAILHTQSLGLGGYVVLEHIRLQAELSHMKVVLFCSSDQELAEVSSRKHKADCYMVSPFNPLDLLRWM